MDEGSNDDDEDEDVATPSDAQTTPDAGQSDPGR